MGIGDEGLGPVLGVGAGEAARVRELEAHVEVAVRLRPERVLVLGHELASQPLQRRQGALAHQELIRIGPAVLAQQGQDLPVLGICRHNDEIIYRIDEKRSS